jgi:hypothetical protein
MGVAGFSLLKCLARSILDALWGVKIGLSYFKVNNMITLPLHLGCLFQDFHNKEWLNL